MQAINRSDANVKINSIVYSDKSDTIAEIPLKKNELSVFKRTISLNKNISYSNPYWLKSVHNEGFFTVTDPMLILQPENSAAYSVKINLNIEGLNLEINKPLVYKSVDPAKRCV